LSRNSRAASRSVLQPSRRADAADTARHNASTRGVASRGERPRMDPRPSKKEALPVRVPCRGPLQTSRPRMSASATARVLEARDKPNRMRGEPALATPEGRGPWPRRTHAP
jgi:hypothetical protein